MKERFTIFFRYGSKHKIIIRRWRFASCGKTSKKCLLYWERFWYSSNPTLGRVVDQIGIDNVLQGKPKHDKKQVPYRIKQCF